MHWFKKNFWLLLLLAVAGLLRLPYSDGRSIFADSELFRILEVTRNITNSALLFDGTMSSFEIFHFGPVYIYLAYPFAALFKFAPYSLATASFVFSLATIVLSYLVVKKWWQNEFLAFTVAFLMSLSALEIQFAKFLINPSFIPFFTLLFFFALYEFLKKPERLMYSVVLAVSFSIATQLHAVTLLALPVIFIAIVFRERVRPRLTQILIFTALTAGLFWPFLMVQSQNSASNFGGLYEIWQNQTSVQFFGSHVLSYIGFWLAPIIPVHLFFDPISILGQKFIYILAGLLLPLLPIVWYNHRNLSHPQEAPRTPREIKRMFFYWFLIPSLIFLFPVNINRDLQIYYFFIFTPLAFMLIGLALAQLYSQGWKLTFYYLICAFTILQIILVITHHIFVSSFKA